MRKIAGRCLLLTRYDTFSHADGYIWRLASILTGLHISILSLAEPEAVTDTSSEHLRQFQAMTAYLRRQNHSTAQGAAFRPIQGG